MQVTIQNSDTSIDSDIQIDPDLHEFEFEGRKYLVRLNLFNGQKVVQGYLKKLCNENSLLFKPSFEMRFCVLNMNTMMFRYAKSPKEIFTDIQMAGLTSCNFEDPARKGPPQIKNQKQNQRDLQYLLHLVSDKRTYIFSANTRTDQVMWFNAFQVFFKVKHVVGLVHQGLTSARPTSSAVLAVQRQKEQLQQRQNDIQKLKQREEKMRAKSVMQMRPNKGEASKLQIKQPPFQNFQDAQMNSGAGAAFSRNVNRAATSNTATSDQNQPRQMNIDMPYQHQVQVQVAPINSRVDSRRIPSQPSQRSLGQHGSFSNRLKQSSTSHLDPNREIVLGMNNNISTSFRGAPATNYYLHNQETEGGNSRGGSKRGSIIPTISQGTLETQEQEEERRKETETITTRQEQIDRDQRMLQLKFIQAAQMNNPRDREFAMKRLQSLQVKLNTGKAIYLKDSDDFRSPKQNENQPSIRFKKQATVEVVNGCSGTTDNTEASKQQLEQIRQQKLKQEQELADAKRRIEEIKQMQEAKNKQEEDEEYYDEYGSMSMTQSITPIEKQESATSVPRPVAEKQISQNSISLLQVNRPQPEVIFGSKVIIPESAGKEKSPLVKKVEIKHAKAYDLPVKTVQSSILSQSQQNPSIKPPTLKTQLSSHQIYLQPSNPANPATQQVFEPMKVELKPQPMQSVLTEFKPKAKHMLRQQTPLLMSRDGLPTQSNGFKQASMITIKKSNVAAASQEPAPLLSSEPRTQQSQESIPVAAAPAQLTQIDTSKVNETQVSQLLQSLQTIQCEEEEEIQYRPSMVEDDRSSDQFIVKEVDSQRRLDQSADNYYEQDIKLTFEKQHSSSHNNFIEPVLVTPPINHEEQALTPASLEPATTQQQPMVIGSIHTMKTGGSGDTQKSLDLLDDSRDQETPEVKPAMVKSGSSSGVFTVSVEEPKQGFKQMTNVVVAKQVSQEKVQVVAAEAPTLVDEIQSPEPFEIVPEVKRASFKQQEPIRRVSIPKQQAQPQVESQAPVCRISAPKQPDTHQQSEPASPAPKQTEQIKRISAPQQIDVQQLSAQMSCDSPVQIQRKNLQLTSLSNSADPIQPTKIIEKVVIVKESNPEDQAKIAKLQEEVENLKTRNTEIMKQMTQSAEEVKQIARISRFQRKQQNINEDRESPGANPYTNAESTANVILSDEYLQTRQKMFARKRVPGGSNRMTESSQRVLKVSNVISSSNSGVQLSQSTRVNMIRARNFKSKGEKVTFIQRDLSASRMSGGVLSSGDHTQDISMLQNQIQQQNISRERQNIASTEDLTKMTQQMLMNNQNTSGSSPSKPTRNHAAVPNQTQQYTKKNKQLFTQKTKASKQESEIQQPMPVQKQNSMQASTKIDQNQLQIDTSNLNSDTKNGGRDNLHSVETPQKLATVQSSVRSLSRTKDILINPKEAICNEYMDEAALIPVQREINFDQLIDQQRDAQFLEKMEQQQRIAQHRRNSMSRASVESQRRLEREEKTRKRRAMKKQQQKLLNSGTMKQVKNIIDDWDDAEDNCGAMDFGRLNKTNGQMLLSSNWQPLPGSTSIRLKQPRSRAAIHGNQATGAELNSSELMSTSQIIPQRRNKSQNMFSYSKTSGTAHVNPALSKPVAAAALPQRSTDIRDLICNQPAGEQQYHQRAQTSLLNHHQQQPDQQDDSDNDSVW